MFVVTTFANADMRSFYILKKTITGLVLIAQLQKESKSINSKSDSLRESCLQHQKKKYDNNKKAI